MLCNDKPVEPTQRDATAAIGTWECPILPIPPALPDTLAVKLAVVADSTYDLKLTQHGTKILFSSIGTWKATADSIFLYGNRCLILDTVPDPDTLATLADSVCGVPIPLQLPEPDTTVWDIRTAQLAVMLKAFPIPAILVPMITTYISNLPLQKKN
jgi:hypothetical protein